MPEFRSERKNKNRKPNQARQPVFADPFRAHGSPREEFPPVCAAGGESETCQPDSPPGTNCIFVLDNPSCLCAMLPCRERIVDRCPSSTTLSKPAIRIRANAR